MKNIGLFILLAFLVHSCKSQQLTEAFHPIVLKAKETSLYTKEVDWKSVNAKFIELTKDKNGAEEMKEGLQYLINSLGDKHATVRYAKDYSILVYYTGQIKDDGGAKIDGNFLNTVINDVTAKFSYQLLENDIGYLKVVGIGAGDVKTQADFIRNGLVELKAGGVEKWIVDLRFNGGGNMEPMIAGLAPLIGEGFIGGSITTHNEIYPYTITDSQFDNYGRLVCEMDSLPKISPEEKVAVLLSRYTISSGEMTAITFKGRPNTRFIGEPSGGYTTGNGFDRISEDLFLAISQGVFIDRNKKRYDGRVGVDEHIEFQHSVPVKDDNQIKYAIGWLNE